MSFLDQINKKLRMSGAETNGSEISKVSDVEEETSIDVNGITPDNLPLDFVKNYLRVDHDLDDVEIQVAILSAQDYVRTYTKIDKNTPLSFGLITPILSLIAYFYENKSPQMKSTEKLDTLFGNILNIHKQDIL